MLNKNKKAWVVAVDMGYGHQRAAYPLKEFAYNGDIINVNNYKGIPKEDLRNWNQSKKFYNFISRFKNFPLIGEYAFKIFDKFQAIPNFYPKRNLSRINLQLLSVISLIKKGWGKHFVEKIKKKNIPLITSFFVPAYMAEIHNFSNDIYILVCDADISRAWAPYKPSISKIKYLAPNHRVVERLKLYGVAKNKIFLSGFPLPLENLGNKNLDILKHDFGNRLVNLDPSHKRIDKYKGSIIKELGKRNFSHHKEKKLSLTFAVGGAGAQRDLGITIVKSLIEKIKNKEIQINLIAGIHNDVNQFFKENIKKLGLGAEIDKGIKIIFASEKGEYFKKFNQILRKTDILWTKPSELSFYVALGIPIIMSDPIGSQEIFNKKWLMTIGAGIPQENPKYTNEWLFEWLEGGVLVEAAINGYFKAEKFGLFNIEKIVFGDHQKIKEIEKYPQY
ncbi:MAG: hypothetical protein GWO87_02210 [Xanthomonadaceae bacterium]|nr:hypothetical protein [Rhodospirillaceae bacterium]NIA17981.1 hypothetical protein [Xanthomonadaceae bacterium]